MWDQCCCTGQWATLRRCSHSSIAERMARLGVSWLVEVGCLDSGSR